MWRLSQENVIENDICKPNNEPINLLDNNRPYSYTRYWTGTSLQVRLMRGVFSNANEIILFLMIYPHMSLHYKLVPVQYRENECGILWSSLFLCNVESLTLQRLSKLLDWHWRKDNNRILGIGLELAWNGGSCGGISLKWDECHLHLKRLLALASVAS